jgi:hypothetical protein
MEAAPATKDAKAMAIFVILLLKMASAVYGSITIGTRRVISHMNKVKKENGSSLENLWDEIIRDERSKIARLRDGNSRAGSVTELRNISNTESAPADFTEELIGDC